MWGKRQGYGWEKKELRVGKREGGRVKDGKKWRVMYGGEMQG